MPHSIQDFKSTLIGGGARPNLFEVVLTNVPRFYGGMMLEDFSILCKAAQLPASNIASIDVPFRGRIFKVAGDRTYDTWTVTVINDIDFKFAPQWKHGCSSSVSMAMDLVLLILLTTSRCCCKTVQQKGIFNMKNVDGQGMEVAQTV